jgi:hypothetical protein
MGFPQTLLRRCFIYHFPRDFLEEASCRDALVKRSHAAPPVRPAPRFHQPPRRSPSSSRTPIPPTAASAELRRGATRRVDCSPGIRVHASHCDRLQHGPHLISRGNHRRFPAAAPGRGAPCAAPRCERSVKETCRRKSVSLGSRDGACLSTFSAHRQSAWLARPPALARRGYCTPRRSAGVRSAASSNRAVSNMPSTHDWKRSIGRHVGYIALR